MKSIDLDGVIIGKDQRLFVIAEAGVNHNGDLEMAKALVDAAAEAKADAVKFQTFKTENIITATAPKAKYHIETTGSDEDQTWFELLKTQELTASMHESLIEHCKQRRIMFFSTPYDHDSVDLLDSLDVPLFKVASTDANNHLLLTHMADKGRPIILSTAMCNLAEVEQSVGVIRSRGVEELVVMQCTGSYPAPAHDANLKAMREIGRVCDVAVGYSDHVPDSTIAIAAVALGACCYEKHLTLDKTLPGPDHRASMEPEELKTLVSALRDTEAALGDGRKRVMPCETENRGRLRKSILALRDVASGDRLTRKNLCVKRAGGRGLPADRFGWIEGKVARVDIPAGSPLDDAMIATE